MLSRCTFGHVLALLSFEQDFVFVDFGASLLLLLVISVEARSREVTKRICRVRAGELVQETRNFVSNTRNNQSKTEQTIVNKSTAQGLQR
eukprot:m.725008 g.725008  ORF g.725008 m.725008 type:complete len:90 (-) comp58844_c0_seq8:25-294(-)